MESKQLAFQKVVETPVGTMDCIVDVDGAVMVFDFMREDGMSNGRRKLSPDLDLRLDADDARFEAVLAQVKAYFAGELEAFDLNFAPHGTAFQKLVWQALCRIPFGQTRTYGELAHDLGKPTASRAVGAANGQNPVAVLIPCHRVIGSNGKLTGYAGGMENKRWLLRHEGALLL